MRMSYNRSESEYGSSYGRRQSGQRSRRRGPKLSSREKQRLVQLVVCILLLVVALAGKGIFPNQMSEIQSSARSMLQTDTDFKAAFVGLGRAISEGEPVLEALGDLWVMVFGVTEIRESGDVPPIQRPLYQQELALLASDLSVGEMFVQRLGIASLPEGRVLEKTKTGISKDAGWGGPEDPSQPALLDTQPQPVYNGPALPDRCTMEKRALGVGATMTPVSGVLSSGFGYRNHPIDGKRCFHYGADIAANTGTPIVAFARGVVDFIGESKIYGKYIQLSHEGGLATFYAHCSQICVKKGQSIVMGEVIGKVGETGNATGPHLHFEIRRDNVFLNPVYYISVQ